jgi:hypothetical protein
MEEIDSWMRVGAVTETERMSSTVTEKMKSLNCQREKGISA